MVKGGYTLVTLPRIVTPYCDSVDGTRDRVTHQRDDTVTARAGVDVQCDGARPHLLRP